jgi:hypothetical protein
MSTIQGSEQPSTKRQALLYATYGSFTLGGFLLIAIILREVKKKRLQWRGIFEMKIPEMRRLGMYKYKDVTLPQFVVNELENIEKFESTAEDIWVVSFPRSGEVFDVLKLLKVHFRNFILLNLYITENIL